MKDFNFFLPYVESNRIDRRLFYIIISGSAIVFLLLSVSLVNIVRINMLSGDIKNIDAKINSPEVVKAKTKLETAEKKYALMKQYYDIVEDDNGGIIKSSTINTGLINDISSTIPKDVSFTNMAIASGEITIQGKASSRPEIAELEHNIRALKSVDNVYISVISGGQESDGYAFSLKCNIKGVK